MPDPARAEDAGTEPAATTPAPPAPDGTSSPSRMPAWLGTDHDLAIDRVGFGGSLLTLAVTTPDGQPRDVRVSLFGETPTFQVSSGDGFGPPQPMNRETRHQLATRLRDLRDGSRGLPELLVGLRLRGETGVGFDDVEQAFQWATGDSLQSYLAAQNPGGHFAGLSPEQFRADYERLVSTFEMGRCGPELALFTAYAEEASFRPTQPSALSAEASVGTLEIQPFGGMNVPHEVAAPFLTELLDGVEVREHGYTGVGTLMVDQGPSDNALEIRVDFTNGTIDPPLRTTTGDEITVADVSRFIDRYLRPQPGKGGPIMERAADGAFRVNERIAAPNGMVILVDSAAPSIIAHELRHAWYDGDSDYRQTALDRARRADTLARECSVLFTMHSYEPDDPDAPRVTPDLVIDEAWNAYNHGNVFDPETLWTSQFSAGTFLATRDLPVDVMRFLEHTDIDTGPIRREMEYGLELRNRSREDAGGEPMSFEEYVGEHPYDALRVVFDLRVLHAIIRQQHPDFYARVQRTRERMVDRVVD